MTGPDMLTRALLRQYPSLAGHVHYVDGRPWCDGVNHTTRCDPASIHPPCIAPEHYSRRESDGVLVCQICGDVKPAAVTR